MPSDLILRVGFNVEVVVSGVVQNTSLATITRVYGNATNKGYQVEWVDESGEPVSATCEEKNLEYDVPYVLSQGSMMQAALYYGTVLGWGVLPIHYTVPFGVDDADRDITDTRFGECSCGTKDCPDHSKHPIRDCVPNGVHDASTNAADIIMWWTKYPNANVAVTNCPLILDIDNPTAMFHLQQKNGPLPRTAMQLTGSGRGMHYFFTSDPSLYEGVGSLTHGIDIKGGIGKYAVVGPSIHASGGRYIWRVEPTMDSIADLPDWAEVMLLAKKRTGIEVVFSSDKIDLDLSDWNLSQEEQDMIIIPAERGERSTHDAKVVSMLIKKGMTDDQILFVYEHFAVGVDSKFGEPKHGKHYLATTIGNMRKRGDRYESIAALYSVGDKVWYANEDSEVVSGHVSGVKYESGDWRYSIVGKIGYIPEYDIRLSPEDTSVLTNRFYAAPMFPRPLENHLREKIDLRTLRNSLLYSSVEIDFPNVMIEMYKNYILIEPTSAGSADWYVWGGHNWVRNDAAGKNIVTNHAMLNIQLLINATQLEWEKEAEEAKRMDLEERIKVLKGRRALIGSMAGNKSFVSFFQDRKNHNEDVVYNEGYPWDSVAEKMVLQNGVLNMRTGTLEAGIPRDYFRSVIPLSWDGIDSPCPRFEQFMVEIFDGDREVVDFMQRLLGYAASGIKKEHILPILWGPEGRNGKDTLLNAIRGVIGMYALVTEGNFLLSSKGKASGSASPEMAIMQGKRIAVTSESNKGVSLDSALIKSLTGSYDMTARDLYKSQTTFRTTHTILFVTNEKPHMPEDDHALWVRLLLIPFTQRFLDDPDPDKPNERPIDKDLQWKLEAEKPGILAWLVRGYQSYMRMGLNVPESVKLATKEYRMEEDKTLMFIDDMLVEDKSMSVAMARLYKEYSTWCKQGNHHLVQKKEFQKALVAHGLTSTEDDDELKGYALALGTPNTQVSPW